VNEALVRRIRTMTERVGLFADAPDADGAFRELVGAATQTPVKHAFRRIAEPAQRRAALAAIRSTRDDEIERRLGCHPDTASARLRRADTVGLGCDERVVELPLAVALARRQPTGHVLDAGAALNLRITHDALPAGQRMVHVTQSAAAEPALLDGNRFSYLWADLRDLPFAAGVFDLALCVSTLEHVGMDNRRYGGPAENSPQSALKAVAELHRVVHAEGCILITVPFGTPRSLGWYRMVGPEEVAAMVATLADRRPQVRYCRYTGSWFDAEPEAILADDPGDGIVRAIAILQAGL
jgi:hypothetical protein